jgi:hypothetical protein
MLHDEVILVPVADQQVPAIDGRVRGVQRDLDPAELVSGELPCTVVVREDTEGAVHVEALDPVAMFSLVDAPGVEPLANEVRARLKHALDAV